MAVLMILAASVISASVTFTPPDKNKVMMSSVKLTPQKAAPKASGTVTLVANPGMSKFALTIEARGLDPKQVYTAWLTKTVKVKGKTQMQEQGVGTAPYTLKVDKKGTASTVYNLTYDPRTKWDSLIVIEHPDKNPKSMKGTVIVLTADVTQLGR